MKNFRSLVVLKRPQHELWSVMRDHLVEFAGNIADIQEIRQIERAVDSNDMVHIINEWRMSQQIPAAIRSMLKIGEVVWIDRNTWNVETGTCSWTIEPSSLGDCITCSGETTFTEAMAGRGTRVAFAGELDVKPGLLGSLGSMEPMVCGSRESLFNYIISSNLRGVRK